MSSNTDLQVATVPQEASVWGIRLPWLGLFIGLGVIVAIIYGYLWPEAPMIRSDSPSYMEAAQYIRDGNFDIFPGRPPGYPVYLWLHGASEAPNRVLFYTQMAMCLASVLLVAMELRAYRVSLKLIVPFVIVGILPFSVEFASYVLSESLAQFLLTVGIVGVSAWLRTGRRWLLVMACVSMGLSGTARPSFQALSLAFAFGLLVVAVIPALRAVRGRAAVGAVGMALGWAVTIGALMVHNYRSFDYLGITPFFGYNMSTRTVPFIERLPDEYAEIRGILINHRNRCYEELSEPYMFIWKSIDDLEKATGLDRTKLSKLMLKLNILLIKKAPLSYVQEVAFSMARYWLPASSKMSHFESRKIQLLWTATHFGIVAIFFLLCLAVIGLAIVALRIRRPYAVRFFDDDTVLMYRLRWLFVGMLFGLIFYNLLVSTLFEVGSPRYRQPTDLFMLAMIAISAELLWRFRIRSDATEKQ